MEQWPVDHARYENGVLEIAGRRLYLLSPDFERPVAVAAGPVITCGARSFRLTHDPGDSASLTLERSLFCWPTPFDTNFMTGSAPSWKRYAYYRLRWHKADGAKLEMLWRLEQGFYRDGGWRPATVEVITNGLIRTRITPHVGRMTAANSP